MTWFTFIHSTSVLVGNNFQYRSIMEILYTCNMPFVKRQAYLYANPNISLDIKIVDDDGN